jgi:hypothetical protein
LGHLSGTNWQRCHCKLKKDVIAGSRENVIAGSREDVIADLIRNP